MRALKTEAALGFLSTSLAHLQQARINRLLLQLVVDFFGSLCVPE